MASTKDIFEAKSFAANIFAAGVFRGTGVAVAVIVPPFLVAAKQGFVSGADTGGHYSQGSKAGDYHIAGQVAGCGNG